MGKLSDFDCVRLSVVMRLLRRTSRLSQCFCRERQARPYKSQRHRRTSTRHRILQSWYVIAIVPHSLLGRLTRGCRRPRWIGSSQSEQDTNAGLHGGPVRHRELGPARRWIVYVSWHPPISVGDSHSPPLTARAKLRASMMKQNTMRCSTAPSSFQESR